MTKTSNKAVMVLHPYIQITFKARLATETETKESLKKLFSTGEQQVMCDEKKKKRKQEKNTYVKLSVPNDLRRWKNRGS